MKKQFLFLIFILIVFIVGCGSQEKPTDSIDEGAGEMEEEGVEEAAKVTTLAEVKIYDSGFRPEEVTISKGGTVKWINRGSEDHTVQSDTFPQEAGIDKKYSGRLAPGQSWEKTFNVEGFYNYYDLYNDELKGKVIVK